MPKGYNLVNGEFVKKSAPKHFQPVKLRHPEKTHPVIRALSERQNELKMSTPVLGKKAGLNHRAIKNWWWGGNAQFRSLVYAAEVLGMEIIAVPKGTWSKPNE